MESKMCVGVCLQAHHELERRNIPRKSLSDSDDQMTLQDSHTRTDYYHQNDLDFLANF